MRHAHLSVTRRLGGYHDVLQGEADYPLGRLFSKTRGRRRQRLSLRAAYSGPSTSPPRAQLMRMSEVYVASSAAPKQPASRRDARAG
jgi:hypothetical protein